MKTPKTQVSTSTREMTSPERQRPWDFIGEEVKPRWNWENWPLNSEQLCLYQALFTGSQPGGERGQDQAEPERRRQRYAVEEEDQVTQPGKR